MKESKSRSKKSKKEKKSKEHRERRKDKKKRRKEEKSKEKLIKKQLAEEIKKTNLEKSAVQETTNENVVKEEDCGPPICLMNRGSRPETKAEYDKRQSRIQRVQDPETGRIRLIKGDGEILEEIVTKDHHKKINKETTDGDGRFFQKSTVGSGRSDRR